MGRGARTERDACKHLAPMGTKVMPIAANMTMTCGVTTAEWFGRGGEANFPQSLPDCAGRVFEKTLFQRGHKIAHHFGRENRTA